MSSDKKLMIEVDSDELYRSEDGYTLAREYGKTPNGNSMGGRWVFRDPTGKFIDFDKYRHDLEEAYCLKLVAKGLK